MDPLLPTIETFLIDTGMSASTFGMKALGDPKLVMQLRTGRELKRRTSQKLKDFIVNYPRDPAAITHGVENNSVARDDHKSEIAAHLVRQPDNSMQVDA